MTVAVKKVVVYSVLLLVSVALWLFTHSEKAQIKRVFTDLERLAAKEAGESVMECAAKAQSLARHFKNGCTFVDIGHGLNTSCSREDIAGGLLAFRSEAMKIVVEFREMAINVDGAEARVEGRFDCSGTEATWPRYEPKDEKFIAHLEKTDGLWLISRVEIP